MRALLPLLALTACELHVPESPGTPPSPVTPVNPPTPDIPTPDPPTPDPPTPTPTPSCDEDAYEPNDVQAVDADGAMIDLTLSGDDVDLFTVQVQTGDLLTIDADFLHADGDLELYLTTPDGDDLASSATASNGESIQYVHTGPSRELWIETHLYTDDDCMLYDLSWSIDRDVSPPPPPPPPPPTPVCIDDSSEDNDTWEDAPELIPVSDGFTSFGFVANDDDWFYVFVQPDEELEITVSLDVPGAIDLVVLDETTEIADTSLSVSSDTVILVEGGSAGQYIDLLVAPLEDDVCAPYTIALSSTLSVCYEDAYEPNDVFPADVSDDNSAAGTLFLGDVDRYDIALYPGEGLWLDATFTDALGDVDLDLYDSEGVWVAGSYTTSNLESVYAINPYNVVETFTVEATLVGASDATCQTYDLDWLIDPPACYDDGLEGDDTPSLASELLPSFGTSVVYELVADDDDWFWLEQLPGEELDLFLEHATPGADLEIVVYDDFGEVAYDFTDQPYAEAYVPLYATSGAFYDVLVRPLVTETCVPYTLTLVSF